GPLPSAILCCNDWLAMGAMQELHLQGYKIPEDISLVGHDDLPFCEDLEPTLTSIHRAEKEIVAKAIDLLSEEIEHGIGAPREILVEGEMVWRNSTGLAPARRAGQS
ncbi:MAG TPA: substrate-binding domain-containing protein, partial [Phycisphaerae bacterium]|nr:substrate-binding domain-containing protein [Phycisphaerae bacterium]